jgi:drug/metabolite transporter (DMT)-like permease
MLLVAIFGLVFLGDDLTVLGGAAILVATGALVILSGDGSSWLPQLKTFTGQPALYGLITGVGFAIGSVGFRAASLSLAPLNFLQSAALTLVVATFLQATLMTFYLKLREPGQVGTVVKLWRKSMIPGLAGAAASAGWFTAMTIEVAAYVRMLGLVEVLYGYLISVVRFHERPSRREIVGSIVLIVAILALLADRAQLL